ncbi:TolC family protein [Saprospira sp. CCB-QB6]|uniref:TolC family protein n=1 Tax=Saprospira sp. CCB-QB6 TaxID=3023936 RepID=UPI00234AA1E6|nr:TolC family protein [Saprospira sp. CCB-QB6]WCL81553.1 TolC family protein [Saprospira sp. CCB-QB6]
MKVYLTAALVFISAWSLQAQEVLTLEEAIEKALSQNYTAKIAATNKKIAEVQNHWGEAGRYPQITATVSNANSYSNVQNPTSFLNGAQLLGTGGTAAVDLQWALYQGGRIRLTKDRLGLQEELANSEANRSLETISQTVAKAYFNAQIQQERLKSQQELLALSQDKIAYIEARRAYGQATEFDLLQIRDAYLNDSIQWMLQRTTFENAQQNLALAMGQDWASAKEIVLPRELSYELPRYNFDSLLEVALQNNREIASERIRQQTADIDIAIQEAALLPTVSLGANISEQLNISQINRAQVSGDWQGGTTLSGALNINLSYNIYNGGKQRRAIEIAKLNQEISQLTILNLEQQLGQNLNTVLALYENQRQTYALSQQLLANSSRNLEIASERFKANTLNFFDYRTIQINYINAYNNVQNAFLSAKQTEFDLLLLSGQLLR